MAKKRDKRGAKEPAPPSFTGFKPLAGGLAEIKAQLDQDAKAKATQENAAKKTATATRTTTAPAARAARTPTAKGRDDEDDELTFHRMMSGVTPLATTERGRVPVTGDTPGPRLSAERAEQGLARARSEADEALERLRSLVDGASRFEAHDDGRRVEGRRIDVPPSVLRSLRRGLLPIDARLDLHGLSAEAARERVVTFLRETRARGERCVLVIHGKGDDVPGGGVLRGEIAAWLTQGKARESVAAFATATNADGGEGAVYVALRR